MNAAIKLIAIAIATVLGAVAMLGMTDDGAGLIDSAYGEVYFNWGAK